MGIPFRPGTARPQTRRARAADFVSVLPLGFAELPFRHVDVPFCQVEVTLREQYQHFDAGKGCIELALKERLLASAREARDRAALLPPGPERQKLLKDARQLKITADLDSWISSTGLAPPK